MKVIEWVLRAAPGLEAAGRRGKGKHCAKTRSEHAASYRPLTGPLEGAKM